MALVLRGCGLISLTVIACTAGAVGANYVNTLSDPKAHSTIKPLVAGFITAILLSAVAAWSEPVANGFAVLVLVSSLLQNGTAVAATLQKKVAK